MDIVKALEATVAQAKRLLEMAEAGYRYDVKTHLEVEDAELNLRTARSNLAKARRDYLTARTKLLWVMGDKLEAINLEEALGVRAKTLDAGAMSKADKGRQSGAGNEGSKGKTKNANLGKAR
jgi:hypothetical protein